MTDHPSASLIPDTAEVLAHRLVRVGWLGLLPVCVGYFVTTLFGGVVAMGLRQLLFLVPLYCAVGALAWLIAVAPAGAERTAWSLFIGCMALIAVSETYYSWYQLFVNPVGPRPGSAYDWINLAAGAVMLGAIAVAVGFGRLGLTARARLAADVVAFSTVVYIGVYHVFARGLLTGRSAQWYSNAGWAAYSSVGLLIVLGVAWAARAANGTWDPQLSIVLAASLVTFAVGVTLWPLWQAAGPSATSQPWVDGLSGTIVLLGYYLMLMAALIRIAKREARWRIVVQRPGNTDEIWPTTILSALVLSAVAACAWWAYHLPTHAPDTWLYVAAATTMTIAMVARTGLASLEIGLLRSRSSSDPVTGALNHRCFQEECENQVAASRRSSVPFGLAVLDLDGFARVNTALGHAAGDGVLAQVVTSLAQAAGKRGKVFRLSADEFAVTRPGVADRALFSFGVDLLSAVAMVDPAVPGMRMSASVGVASCTDGSCDREELLRRAKASEEWAKYHGKARVVAYDERIGRALGSEGRLRAYEVQAHRDVARALSAAADARDPHDFYHSRNVSSLSVLVGEDIGLAPNRVSTLEIAAMLHDVGRIALPDVIFDGGARNSAEREKVREHSVLGAQLVESLGIAELPAMVRHHHECWDGSGFPDRLVGEAIPIESRIIALADAYDAMTSGRHGGPRLSKSAALQEIDHGIGSRFDPRLAEQFIHLVGTTVALGWSDGWRVPR